MRLTITMKDENGRLYALPDRYEFDPDELNRLVADFNTYCSDSNGQPGKRGGVYKCTAGSDEKMLFLKFDQIAYIG